MTTPLYVLSADGAAVDQQIVRPAGDFTLASGAAIPWRALRSWTDAALAAEGVYRVTPATLPANHIETSRAYARSGDRFVESIVSSAESDADRAARMTMSAEQFDAYARPLLESKVGVADHPLENATIGAPLESWMIDFVLAIPDAALVSSLSLPNAALLTALSMPSVGGETATQQAARVKKRVAGRIFGANTYYRSDMDLLLGQFGVTGPEVDQIFLDANGG